MATTVRIYNPSGHGYREVTTNRHGVEIREVHYGEDDVVEQVVERDPHDGSTTTTTYEEGRKTERTVHDADGSEALREAFDENGRLARRTTIEDFTGTTWEYHYDRAGRLVRAQRTDSGGIAESVDFDYDRDGRLRRATRHVSAEGGMQLDAHIEFDENAEITDAHGNIEALLERIAHLLAVEYGEANAHVTRDHLGNRVWVRHNPDGSFDIEVNDRQGRLVMRGYTASGRCYAGDECPLRDAALTTP